MRKVIFLFFTSLGFSPELWAAELRLSGTIPAQDVVSLAIKKNFRPGFAGPVLALKYKSNHVDPVRLQIYETSSKKVLYQKIIQFNEVQFPLSHPRPMTVVLTLL